MKRAAFAYIAALSLAACAGQSGTGGPITPVVNGASPGGASGEAGAALSGRSLFVGLSNHTIQAFSESNGSALGTLALPGANTTMPTSMLLSADGTKLFVALAPPNNCTYGASALAEFDTATDALVSSQSEPDQFTYGVLSEDGTLLATLANYAVNNQGAESFAVDLFATSDLHLIKRVPLPNYQYPNGLAISSDGSTAYVTGPVSGSNSVSNIYKVDIASGAVTTLHQLNTAFIRRTFLDATGTKLYVQTGTAFVVLDAASGAQIGSVPLPPNGAFYEDSAQNASRSSLFTISTAQSLPAQDIDAVISQASSSITSSFSSSNLESNAAISPDGLAGLGFVTNNSSLDYVDVYSLQSGTLQSTAHVTATNAYITAAAGQ